MKTSFVEYCSKQLGKNGECVCKNISKSKGTLRLKIKKLYKDAKKKGIIESNQTIERLLLSRFQTILARNKLIKANLNPENYKKELQGLHKTNIDVYSMYVNKRIAGIVYRDYVVENIFYERRPTRKIAQKFRKATRKRAEKMGLVKRGDGKEVHHIYSVNRPEFKVVKNKRIHSRMHMELLKKT